MATSPSNFLLASLPKEDCQRLVPDLRAIAFTTGQTLYQSGESIHTVYFPEQALVTLTTLTKNHSIVEQGLISHKGMIGLPAILGGRQFSTSSAVVLLGGSAMALDAEALQIEFNRGQALQQVLLRYTEFCLSQVSQLSGCTYWHSLDQRLARWLLMMWDANGAELFPVTQRRLAEIMGVRLSIVAEAIEHLQKAGLIHYTRETLQILDHLGLELATCECYEQLNQEWQRLMEASSPANN